MAKTSKKEVKETTVGSEKSEAANLVQAKMQELIDLIDNKGSEVQTNMICLIGNSDGVHIAMTGKGEDIAILVASSIVSNEDVSGVINHGGMMASLKVQADKEGIELSDLIARENAAKAVDKTTEAQADEAMKPETEA